MTFDKTPDTAPDKTGDARRFCREVRELAAKYGLDFFVVTEGASATSCTGCEAVKNARDAHERWERGHGIDTEHDWENKIEKDDNYA